MKKISAVLTVFLLILCSGTGSPASGTVPGITAEQALSRLEDGNSRFSSEKTTHPNTDVACRVTNAKEGQHPFVTLLSCSDSRVPVELIFDSGIGDIFVIRVAGNVSGTDEAGSMEYAVEHLGTPLLVVLGHSRCGAVTAVAQNAKVHGNVEALVRNIRPAVAKAKAAAPGASEENLIPEAIRANTWQSIEDLFRISAPIREKVRSGELKVVGAIYDVDSGVVRFMGPHPDQEKLLGQPGAPKPAGNKSKKH